MLNRLTMYNITKRMTVSTQPPILWPNGAVAESVPLLTNAGLAGAPPNFIPPPTVGFALLTAAITADVNPPASAPRMRAVSRPLVRIRNVGIAVTENCWARPWAASTSILAKAAFPGTACFDASAVNTGAMVLQGPHQVAWTTWS